MLKIKLTKISTVQCTITIASFVKFFLTWCTKWTVHCYGFIQTIEPRKSRKIYEQTDNYCLAFL